MFLIFLLTVITAYGSKALNVNNYPVDDCFRDCSSSVARVCYVHFHLEHYHVMGPACGNCSRLNAGISAARDCFNDQCITADGIERGVMSINRKIPGPQIHVCKDDLIVVDVTNMMGGTSAAIHWHGFHQRKTPFYDGVPFVTQCPIDFSTTFRYQFQATQAGTQFYHSHSGHHKVNGQYGGIVVRQNPKDDPNSGFYDRDLKEHLILVSDWMKQDGEMFMPGLRSDPIGIQPTNLLINGRGATQNKTSGRFIVDTPLEVFRVQKGQKYRFRFINSMSHVCPAVLEIQDHSLLIIASDSYDLQPVSVDSLYSTSGERYDFVINANQTGAATFWIRIRALGSCEARQLEQFAVLAYDVTVDDDFRLAYPASAPKFSPRKLIERSLNHPNSTCGNGDVDNLCITDLLSYVAKPEITDVEPDHQFYLGFSNYRQNVREVFKINHYGHFMNLHDEIVMMGAINNISFIFPSFSPLSQPEEVSDDRFCDENSKPKSCETGKICSCVHRLKVKMNSVVELIVVDESQEINAVNHPFHLHGYELFVMGMGQHPNKIPMTVKLAEAMMYRKKLTRSSVKKHVIKDTISIPSKGYTIFRFKADNPGWWLLHCHFEWHLAVGMGLVLQVGETDDMVKPPENFPKCNNFQPDVSFDVPNTVGASIASTSKGNQTYMSDIKVDIKALK